MLCDFGERQFVTLESSKTVACKVCNREITTRHFPITAACGGSDVDDYLRYVAENTTGLGDIVSKAISVATLGIVQPTGGCGCGKRKAWLNNLWSWRTHGGQA